MLLRRNAAAQIRCVEGLFLDNFVMQAHFHEFSRKQKNASDGFLEATCSVPSAQMRTRTASHRIGEDHPI